MARRKIWLYRSIRNLQTIGVQRKEIYSVIFEIKRVQFSITVKRLVIDKADYSFRRLFVSAVYYPSIALSINSPSTPVYRECFNFDFHKEILGGSLLSILTCASSTPGLIFALLRLSSRMRIFYMNTVLLFIRQNKSFKHTHSNFHSVN